MVTIAYGRLLVAAGICGAGLIAGLLIQQPRVDAAKAATELAKAEAKVQLQAQEVKNLERLVSGERAARNALAAAQAKAKEATDDYHREMGRITAAVDGLPRRVSRLCQPQAGTTSGGAGEPAGSAAAAAGGLVHPGDGVPARPDFDAAPWREYAKRCESVAAGLRACLK